MGCTFSEVFVSRVLHLNLFHFHSLFTYVKILEFMHIYAVRECKESVLGDARWPLE